VTLDKVSDKFKLLGKTVVITGGAGLLGVKHAQTIAEYGGVPVLIDINDEVEAVAKNISKSFSIDAIGIKADITIESEILSSLRLVKKKLKTVHILINNATNNPKMTDGDSKNTRFESMPIDKWDNDIEVGLKGAFLCSRVFGSEMVKNGGGVILNIASDLGLIAPDQRIYRSKNMPDDMQPVKPVSYSIVKHGIIGLTKYLSTYWAHKNIRANSLCPGGIYQDQDSKFVKKLTNLIPMGRMANEDEYKAAIIFLISEASSYMTGSNLVIDGGRTVW